MEEVILLKRIEDTPYIVFSNGEQQLLNLSVEKFLYKEWKGLATPWDLKNFLDKIIDFPHPLIIYQGVLECPPMSNLLFNDQEKRLIEEHGLHIFLTENLLKYSGPRLFLEKTNIKSHSDLLENNKGLVYGEFDHLRCTQFDSIDDLLDNNQLESAYVYILETNVGRVFSKKYPRLNFIWKDIYILTAIDLITNSPCSCYKKSVDFKFVNYNWRYEPHRHILASFLSNFDSKISWYYKSSTENFKKNIWFDIDNWQNIEPQLYEKIISGLNLLNDRTPCNLDESIEEFVVLEGTIKDRLSLPKQYINHTIDPLIFDNCFCSIISESTFVDHCSYITEKTLFSIWNSTPFIIAGAPESLKHLRKLGFETFSEYWNEDYDAEWDHEKRIYKILKIIENINDIDNRELFEIYKKMIPILEHNKNQIFKITKDLQIKD